MTTAISHPNAVGFVSELTALLLQNETNQAESAQLQRDAAREDFLQDAQAQVNELTAAASASMTTAFVSAAFTVAGGACQVAGAISQFKADTNAAGLDPKNFCSEAIELREVVAAQTMAAKIWSAVGKTSSELAQPTTMAGQSIAAHDQAEAKRWESAGTQAQWQASDASTTIDTANKQADTLLDTLQGLQRDQNAANNAVIGRI